VNTLILTIGLPKSGKTTWAREQGAPNKVIHLSSPKIHHPIHHFFTIRSPRPRFERMAKQHEGLTPEETEHELP